jgi:hypothetical protein
MVGTYVMAISAALFSASAALTWIYVVNHFDPHDVAPLGPALHATKTAA